MRPNSKTPAKSKQGPPVKPKPNKNSEKDPVEVYCRLRPLKNLSSLVAAVRWSDNLVRLSANSANKNDYYYNFKYVFDSDATQKEVFDRVAYPLIEDLLKGQNGLLFTYGITSSGKTHTVTGSPREIGILPRALDVIFNSIEQYQSRKFQFKSDGQNYFNIQSSPDAIIEWQQEKIVPKTPTTPFGRANKVSFQRSAKKELDNWDNREKDDSRIEEVNTNYAHSVFVSYVEIYNNYIYDLLDDSLSETIKIRQQPQSKALREDSRHRVFVSGVTEVEVKSAEEAIEQLLRGIRRRRIAQTVLNAESSRSHSVFSIRLVQAPWDTSGAEVVQDNRFLTVSQLSLVDLAGSERSLRTQNTGERLREAGNINNSLMVLRTCLENLRENQKFGYSKVIPYRDNKLTHLFKSYFEGEGKIRMVICVNPSSEEYDETIHVMKFAELAQEVMTVRGPTIDFFRQTIPKTLGVDLASINLLPPLPDTLFNDVENDKIFPEWFECFEMRKKKRNELIMKVQDLELNFRSRITEIESENMMLKQQNTCLKMDLNGREQQIKLYENKCNEFERKNEASMKRVSELEKGTRALKVDIDHKETQLDEAKKEMERISNKTKGRLESERERLRRIFGRLLAEKQTELEREQCLSKEKMHLVREILNADNTNWEFLKENRESFFPSLGITQASASPQIPYSLSSAQTPKSDYPIHKRKTDFDGARTPLTGSTSKGTTSQVFTVGSDRENVNFSPPPVINPRHRRSLSSGAEKWIDHRPPGTIDLGTVMKPKIKNKKSVSNLKASDILNNASKYALTHHEADRESGQVETHIYKGEVIPSSSGGAQVIFNDVETLRQGSPPGRKRTISDSHLLSPEVQEVLPNFPSQNINVTKRSRNFK